MEVVMAFTLPDLPYAYDALEPYMDAETVRIHHDLHHGGYVAKLNAALETLSDFQSLSIEALLANLKRVPSSSLSAVRNNGAQHFNHTFFWESMAPGRGGEPTGHLRSAIEASFGSFNAFHDAFSSKAAGQFGSGWAWLYRDASSKTLAVTSTSNEGTPLLDGHVPLLVIDVWEHAYYLKYQNRRPDYIKAWWNLVNWDCVDRRLSEAS